ncbi:hypothetical protein [Methylocystis parvus]|uniref:hypothetical protein n=1 Tax=Methylocystis parvus TaxID=134 RepID=UPI003C78657F
MACTNPTTVARYDIEIVAGNSKTIPITFYEDAAKVNPLDLTGSTIIFRAVWDGGSLSKSSPSSGITISDPTTGAISIALTVANSRALPEGKVAKYEIERRIGGAETTLLLGYLNVVNWGANDDA